jgi:hypothetical protein
LRLNVFLTGAAWTQQCLVLTTEKDIKKNQRKMKKIKYAIILILVFPFQTGCNQLNEKKNTLKADEKGFVILTDAQIENIVKRSYQYVAMYNVNNKFACHVQCQ